MQYSCNMDQKKQATWWEYKELKQMRIEVGIVMVFSVGIKALKICISRNCKGNGWE